jgi:hypothetical protein
MQSALDKKLGFASPPVAFFTGSWQAFKSNVVAHLTCKSCGSNININFRGNPDTMTEAGIGRWILRRAEQRHQCPAVMDTIMSNTKKYFADIFRGKDKLKEQEYKAHQRGLVGKPTLKA